MILHEISIRLKNLRISQNHTKRRTTLNQTKLLENWLQEEKVAHIHGWDFSHISGKYDEENDLPWDYKEIVREQLTNEKRLLDIDTGGAEFLLSLNHPYHNLSATEAYPPNVELCKKKLLPLGVDFKEADGCDVLPYADESFDIVINRHGDFNVNEIYRVLKNNGVFITEQVGAENDRELVQLLLDDVPIPFPHQYLKIVKEAYEKQGFSILRAEEAYRPIRFGDVGALVWFARIIEWEFPGFSVENCFSNLLHAQEILEQNGVIEGRIHRFLLVVQK